MFESISSFVLIILSIMVIIIFVGSIYSFFYAIFLFIFSAGDPDKIKHAWNSIRFMILGIVLTIAFLFVFPIIFKRIKLPWYEKYTANNIFQNASYLTKEIFRFSREAVTDYQSSSSSSSSSSSTTRKTNTVIAPSDDDSLDDSNGTLEL